MLNLVHTLVARAAAPPHPSQSSIKKSWFSSMNNLSVVSSQEQPFLVSGLIAKAAVPPHPSPSLINTSWFISMKILSVVSSKGSRFLLNLLNLQSRKAGSSQCKSYQWSHRKGSRFSSPFSVIDQEKLIRLNENLANGLIARAAVPRQIHTQKRARGNKRYVSPSNSAQQLLHHPTVSRAISASSSLSFWVGGTSASAQ